MRTFGLRYISTVFRLGCAVAAAALVTASGVASGQDYPTKPIRLIVGFPPGGSNDIMARIVAQPLSQVLGVPVIVENKPGANAIIASEFIAKSAPDGYTLYWVAAPFTVNPALEGKAKPGEHGGDGGIAAAEQFPPTPVQGGAFGLLSHEVVFRCVCESGESLRAAVIGGQSDANTSS